MMTHVPPKSKEAGSRSGERALRKTKKRRVAKTYWIRASKHKTGGHFVIATVDAEGNPTVRQAEVGVVSVLELKETPRPSSHRLFPVVRATTSSLKSLRLFTADEIYSLVVPKRTLARRKVKNEPLTVEETDKAQRLARIATYAEKVFGEPEKAGRWLRKPKRQLDGETPLVYLASESGARLVEDMLTQIDYGIVP